MLQYMKNVRHTFYPLEKPEGSIPPGYQEIKGHLIFDVKMGENFRQKSRSVAGVHMTETHATLTYASVVSRYSVHIALTIAALNGLGIFLCDIQNTYLTDECQENIWTRAFLVFSSESVANMIFGMVLYGLKSSGAAFWVHLDKTLNYIRLLSTKADPDVTYHTSVKPNGFEYY